jgi:VanZ family protein
MSNIIQAAAIMSLIALAVLSWLPKPMMETRTGAPSQVEHWMAYAGAGVLLKCGWPLRRTRWMGVGLVALAAVLEVGQHWAPGRTPQMIDFASSAAGTFLGLAFTHVAMHRLREALGSGPGGRKRESPWT